MKGSFEPNAVPGDAPHRLTFLLSEHEACVVLGFAETIARWMRAEPAPPEGAPVPRPQRPTSGLGCQHGRKPGQPCPHCMGISTSGGLTTLTRERAKEAGYEGDPCNECGQFMLTRNGTCLKCDGCGATTGCS